VIRGGNLTQQPPTRLGRDLSLELRFRDRLEVRAAANELLLDVDVRDSALAIKRLEVGLNITWRRLVRLSIPHHPATVRWWTHYRPLACRGCQSQQLLSTESLIRLCAESGPRHSLPVQQVTVLGHGRKDSLSALAILGRKRQGGQAASRARVILTGHHDLPNTATLFCLIAWSTTSLTPDMLGDWVEYEEPSLASCRGLRARVICGLDRWDEMAASRRTAADM
jgi:hypothetical protein